MSPCFSWVGLLLFLSYIATAFRAYETTRDPQRSRHAQVFYAAFTVACVLLAFLSLIVKCL
jgi:formate hydrogenlyase subunit 3/multisubunit Na+/H+ antiporter MnhD subunit